MAEDKQQGGINIESITIVNQYGDVVDLALVSPNVRLYESIYNKFVTGEIAVVDGLNILKNFRFTGQESIRISFSQQEGLGEKATTADSIDKTFRVYSVTDLQRIKSSTQTYIIKICDPRMFRARRHRISQTLRGSYTNMLVGIVTDEKHGLNVPKSDIDLWEETTPDKIQFIAPNWTIAKIIDHFTSQASIGKDTHTKNGMFFYQTLNGGFRFASIDTMSTQEFPLEFSYLPRSADSQTDVNLNAPQGQNTQIIQYSKPQLFDTLRGTVGGAYASSLKSYDPLRKLEGDIIFDLEESHAKGEHVSGHPMVMTGENEITFRANTMTDPNESPSFDEVDIDLPINEAYESVVLYTNTPNHDFDNSDSVGADDTFIGDVFKDNASLERRALMENLQQHRILVTIPVRTDLSVGTIIKLGLPQPESQHDNSDTSDILNDDRYLIVEHCVDINPLTKRGVSTIECVKQSYTKKVRDHRPASLDQGTTT